MEDLFRKERDFINAVLNTAGVLVVVINREGKIVRFNCAAEKFTGYTLAIIAQPLEKVKLAI
jgi:PAS domain S-box-containing protein